MAKSVARQPQTQPHAVCEFVDVDGPELEVTIWVRGVDLEPETLGELVVRSRFGGPVAKLRQPVEARVSTTGEWSLCRFVFRVPIAKLRRGSLEFKFSYDGAVPKSLIPSAGVLAESRFRPLGDRGFYKVQPGAGRHGVWLRVDSGDASARFARCVLGVFEDVYFMARGRRLSWVRFARFFTKPFVPRGEIWLIGEREESARDNSAVLFEYLRKNEPDRRVYYVIDKTSPMRANVAGFGNVVDHTSLRHKMLMLHATTLINSYSIKHMIPATWHPGAYMQQVTWRLEAKRVYLKHGVHLSPDAMKRTNGGYDLVCTVGQRERDELRRTTGYREQLVLTGLARYDNLAGSRGEGSKQKFVLFMPTWRRYLVPKLFSGEKDSLVAYEGSRYQQFVDSLLSSEPLNDVLAAHDLKMIVVPHNNMAEHINEETVSVSNVEILPAASADIPGLLKNCSALVTDYSSVHFDAAYAGAPVIYAQFDAEDFKQMHGASSWFDFAVDGFGPVVETGGEVVEYLSTLAEVGFARDPAYEARVDAIFEFNDDANCERIIAAIHQLG